MDGATAGHTTNNTKLMKLRVKHLNMMTFHSGIKNSALCRKYKQPCTVLRCLVLPWSLNLRCFWVLETLRWTLECAGECVLLLLLFRSLLGRDLWHRFVLETDSLPSNYNHRTHTSHISKLVLQYILITTREERDDDVLPLEVFCPAEDTWPWPHHTSDQLMLLWCHL